MSKPDVLIIYFGKREKGKLVTTYHLLSIKYFPEIHKILHINIS